MCAFGWKILENVALSAGCHYQLYGIHHLVLILTRTIVHLYLVLRQSLPEPVLLRYRLWTIETDGLPRQVFRPVSGQWLKFGLVSENQLSKLENYRL